MPGAVHWVSTTRARAQKSHQLPDSHTHLFHWNLDKGWPLIDTHALLHGVQGRVQAHFWGVSLMRKGPKMLAHTGAVKVSTRASCSGKYITANR